MVVPHEDRAAAVRAAVEVFYERVLADAVLSPWFVGVDMARLRAHQRAFLTSALVGGDIYRGRSLREAHRGMAITDAAFDRTVDHLRVSLEQVGVPRESAERLCAQVDAIRAQVVEA